MNTRLARFGLALSGVLILASPAPAFAQETSAACRLFPLACPGPVPEKPPPLVGTPEEQAQTQAPPEKPVRSRHRTRKHAAKPNAQ